MYVHVKPRCVTHFFFFFPVRRLLTKTFACLFHDSGLACDSGLASDIFIFQDIKRISTQCLKLLKLFVYGNGASLFVVYKTYGLSHINSTKMSH